MTVESILRYANLTITNTGTGYTLNDADILDSAPIEVTNGYVYAIS